MFLLLKPKIEQNIFKFFFNPLQNLFLLLQATQQRQANRFLFFYYFFLYNTILQNVNQPTIFDYFYFPKL